MPLRSGDHSGVLPQAAGEHHYPLPVKAADFFRYDDFRLWVTLPDGTHAAVAPVGRRGSGDGRVRLMYARHGTTASAALIRAQRDHKAVILPDTSGEARQAFLRQQLPISVASRRSNGSRDRVTRYAPADGQDGNAQQQQGKRAPGHHQGE